MSDSKEVRTAMLTKLGLVLELETGFRYSLEHRFHPVRKFRFDLAFVEARVALEVDGGNWVYGRHARPVGQRRDNEKINLAQLLGWKVFRVDWVQVKKGEAFALLKEALDKLTPEDYIEE